MKVAEVDTAGIDSEAQPLARDNRRGYSVVEGGSSPGAPSWFWGGLLLLGLGFVLVTLWAPKGLGGLIDLITKPKHDDRHGADYGPDKGSKREVEQ